MKRYRSNATRTAGYTLVEIMVAISIFVVVVTITGTLIVQANQNTRKVTGSAFTQSQLLDVVSRISREVAVADPIAFAAPTEIETVTVRDRKSVRTRFRFVETDPAKHTGEIGSKTSTGAQSPDVATPPVAAPMLDTNWTPAQGRYKVVATNIKLPTAPVVAGGPPPTLLAYVDGNSNTLGDLAVPAQLVPSDLPKIARVKINLNASLADRSKLLTMITSMATRLGMPAGLVGENLPKLDCPTVTSSWATPFSSLQLDWTAGYGAMSFWIQRSPAWPLNPGGITQAGTTLTDPGLAAGTTYSYTVIPQGPAGQPACPQSLALITAPEPPVLSGSRPAAGYDATLTWPPALGATGYLLQRDGVTIQTYATGAGPVSYVDLGLTPGVTYSYQVLATNSTGNSPSNPWVTTPPPTPITLAGNAIMQKNTLTWGAIPEATSYSLYRVGTAAPIYTGVGLTFADLLRPWATAADYKVTYVNPQLTVTTSNVLTLTTQAAPLFTPTLSAYPTDYNDNYLEWTSSPGAVRYDVFRSPTLAGVYALVKTVAAPTALYTDSTAVLGSTWYYKVVAYSSAAALPAASSVANDVLQYPAVPVTAGFASRGSGATSGNVVDGTNHVAWAASAGSTKYKLYDTQGGGAALAATTAALSYDHPGRPLGTRFDYWSVGVNACHNDVDDPKVGVECVSPNTPGGPTAPVKVGVYQRPGAPAPWVTRAPDLNGNFTSVAFTRNGDQNNPAAAKFCDPGETLCDYSLERSIDGSPWATTSWTPSFGSGVYTLDPYTSNAVDSNYWGRIFDWRIHTWNPGGWSDYSANDRTLSYPSPFAMRSVTMNAGYKLTTTAGLAQSRIYDQDLTWGGAYGTGVAYRYRTTTGGAFTGFSTALSTPTSKALAGYVYPYTVQAQSDNGLIRSIGYTIQTAPATIRHIAARWQCLESNDTWRIRYDSVDSRPITGFAPDKARYDLLPSPYDGGVHNVGTDGVHPAQVNTYFTANTIQTGWASGAMQNIKGWGAYMTFGNINNTKAGVNRVLNYATQLSLGTNRGISAIMTGCTGGNTAWEYVSAVTANYPDGNVPRTLTAYNP